jgi:hypothetical protein
MLVSLPKYPRDIRSCRPWNRVAASDQFSDFRDTHPGGPPRGYAHRSGSPGLRFFRWYNREHRHSSLGLLTPAMVHHNQTDRVLQQRQQVLDAAYQLHPERFVRSAPRPPAVPTEAWINKPVQLT